MSTAGELTKRPCSKCHKEFNTRGPYTVCYRCNQSRKNAECESCDEPFYDSGGRYTRCYKCSAALKDTVCDGGCGVKFDGKGKYTTCYGCNQKKRKYTERIVTAYNIEGPEDLAEFLASGGDIDDIPGFV